jgi:hypothetical protein
MWDQQIATRPLRYYYHFEHYLFYPFGRAIPHWVVVDTFFRFLSLWTAVVSQLRGWPTRSTLGNTSDIDAG